MARQPVVEVRSDAGETLLRVRLLPVVIGLVAATAVTLGVIALLLLPTLQRVDHAVAAMTDAIPAIEQMQPDLASVDGNMEREVVPAMRGLDGDLAAIGDRVGEIQDPLTRLEARMVDLQGAIDELGQPLDTLPLLREDLGAMRADIAAMRSGIAGLSSSLEGTEAAMGDLVDLMERLVGSFDRVVALLDETEQHVENIDRKTGPAPPDVDE